MISDRGARLAEAALTKALSLRFRVCLGPPLYGQRPNLYQPRDLGHCRIRAGFIALDRNLALAQGWIGLAKYFIGRGEESEGHVLEGLRLSPRDTQVYKWISVAGGTELALARDEEAVVQLRQSIEANRNFPLSHLRAMSRAPS